MLDGSDSAKHNIFTLEQIKFRYFNEPWKQNETENLFIYPLCVCAPESSGALPDEWPELRPAGGFLRGVSASTSMSLIVLAPLLPNTLTPKQRWCVRGRFRSTFDI